MPERALPFCSYPGCGVRVSHGACAVHRRPTPARIRGNKLQKLRRALFARQPFCAHCGRILAGAWIRDHIVPLAEGGLDLESNVQALCIPCSDTKSLRERLRGVQRWRP